MRAVVTVAFAAGLLVVDGVLGGTASAVSSDAGDTLVAGVGRVPHCVFVARMQYDDCHLLLRITSVDRGDERRCEINISLCLVQFGNLSMPRMLSMACSNSGGEGGARRARSEICMKGGKEAALCQWESIFVAQRLAWPKTGLRLILLIWLQYNPIRNDALERRAVFVMLIP